MKYLLPLLPLLFCLNVALAHDSDQLIHADTVFNLTPNHIGFTMTEGFGHWDGNSCHEIVPLSTDSNGSLDADGSAAVYVLSGSVHDDLVQLDNPQLNCFHETFQVHGQSAIQTVDYQFSQPDGKYWYQSTTPKSSLIVFQ